ncbi:ribosomal protein S18 acetylase RimI-like enzyme [Streptomyces sp. Ag109_O5-1]|uniref:GNAT family N-acetyltransferase n=1 Tax=Streptomyces TaxID=1883 RepID=UPI000F9F76A7|nr:MULTISPECIES: GNAT family N-acetyltransferase [Streptomyces]RPE44541.1 ribosomal protein S18 acetylase RimI-like enzyme [Streptomyces sp. Ag109_O5-1]
MADPYIRTALPDDEEELALLDRVTWSTLHAVTPEPQPPYPPYFDERHTPDQFLVAELDRRIVGYVRLARPTPLAANTHVLQIQGLAVTEEVRGRGVGRILIRAAVEEARRRGARRLTLRVLGHNTPARKLYEAEGFAVEGVLPEEFLLDGRYVDDVLMGRTV